MRKYKKEDAVSYALGMTLTFELIKYKASLARKIYISSKIIKNEAYIELLEICKKKGIEMVESEKAFHILCPKGNCFVIGEFEKYNSELERQKNHVVLVHPSDAGNLGTIIRSCRGFGMKDIAVILPAVDVFDPKTIRASMGAIFGVRIQTFHSYQEYKGYYSERQEYPFMLNAKKALKELAVQTPYSLIFGNEATGLPKEFEGIGTSVIIKHSDEIDSLNLPIAVSIALYQTSLF